jgi:hypothetical protein
MELKKEYVDERTGITYTLKGEYYIPNLSIPKDTNFIIGRYGKAHLRYIKQYNKPFYMDLLLDGKLNNYLHSIDERCNTLLESIITKLAKEENVTEDLKASQQLEWVARMNNIKNRAEEFVYNEIIYV